MTCLQHACGVGRFAAFVWLRISAPHMVRPFRVALPWWGCALMLLPASLLLVTLIALPILRADVQARRSELTCHPDLTLLVAVVY